MIFGFKYEHDESVVFLGRGWFIQKTRQWGFVGFFFFFLVLFSEGYKTESLHAPEIHIQISGFQKKHFWKSLPQIIF